MGNEKKNSKEQSTLTMPVNYMDWNAKFYPVTYLMDQVIAYATVDHPIIFNGIEFSIRLVQDHSTGEGMLLVNTTNATDAGILPRAPLAGNTILWEGNDWKNDLVITDTASNCVVSLYNISICARSENEFHDFMANPEKGICLMLKQCLKPL